MELYQNIQFSKQNAILFDNNDLEDLYQIILLTKLKLVLD